MKTVFILSILIYTFADIAHGYYAKDIDYIHISASQSHAEWYMRVFRDIGAMVAASLAIIISISNYPSTNKKT